MAMEQPKRFEIQLPADRRQELDNLAREIGTNAADLARLAIVRLLADQDAITGRKVERAA